MPGPTLDQKLASIAIIALFSVLSIVSLTVGGVAAYRWVARDEPTRFYQCRHPQTGASMTCRSGDGAWRDAALTSLPLGLVFAGAAGYGISRRGSRPA